MITIRKAEIRDLKAIAAFNQKMALETEGKEISKELSEKGVKGLIENEQYGFYLVAEVDSKTVASLMIAFEWSDWSNGLIWWIHSVYVEPAMRRKGIFRALYNYAKEMAMREGCALRLYVEKDNQRAQKTYREMGMQECPYLIFEERF